MLQVLLEGELGVDGEDRRADRRVHAIVHAGREIVEQQRLQALVHAPRHRREVVVADDGE